jgi:hypothetical protein
MQSTKAVFALLFAVSTFALAQKNEVSLSVGAVATPDQQIVEIGLTCPVGFPNCGGPLNTSTSTGVAFAGSYTRQLFNFHIASLGVEFPIVGVPSRDETSQFIGAVPVGLPPFVTQPRTVSESSVFFTPSARIKFLPSRAVSPFFSIGGGWAHFETTSSINRGALQFGGGVDFKTPLPHIGIRAEARDFWARRFAESGGIVQVSPERLHNVFAGAGIVFKF